MIARLRGLVDGIGEDSAVIDVGGVGYLVHCSSRTLSALGRGQGEVALFVETHVREDRIQLFGFMAEAERAWFRLLFSVQGVGARVALGILSTMAVDEIVKAIALQDKAPLTRAPNVGPKLAQRIVAELKDKAADRALAASAAAQAGTPIAVPAAEGALGDAVSALVNLGFAQAQAMSAVARASREAGAEADVATLIRHGLRELSA